MKNEIFILFHIYYFIYIIALKIMMNKKTHVKIFFRSWDTAIFFFLMTSMMSNALNPYISPIIKGMFK